MTSDHRTRQSTPPRADATSSAAAPIPGKQTLSEHAVDRSAAVQQRAAITDGAADPSPGVAAPPAGPDAGRVHAAALDGARDHGAASAGPGRLERLFGRHDAAGPAMREAPTAGTASSGAPLPTAARSKFESSLGVDLSPVRIHTDPGSAAAASSVSAMAYTIGQDIHFGAGQYAPSSASGEHLLAHEVAHTVQQRGEAPRPQHKLAVSSSGDRSESEADEAASAMVAGRPASVGAAPVMIARQPATTPAPGLSDADKIAALSSNAVGKKAVDTINMRIGMAQLHSQGKEMQFQPSMVNRADAAIRKQFGGTIPSGRNYVTAYQNPKDAGNTKDPKNAQSVRALDPMAWAKSLVPDGDQAKAALRMAAIVMETSQSVMDQLSITDPSDPILQNNVVLPLFKSNTVTVQILQNYEVARMGGLTKFTTGSDGSTNTAVTFPNKSRNLGHIVLHEAMHFYVNEDYRSAAEARKDRQELMEGGAEYFARIVIQSQLSADPDFEINFSTYSSEFSYINNMSIATKAVFPVLYFGGRTDLLPLPPSGS